MTVLVAAAARETNTIEAVTFFARLGVQ